MITEDFFHIENKKYLTAWMLVTACFALWGFANNVTTPMVNTFSKIFRISTLIWDTCAWHSLPPCSSRS